MTWNILFRLLVYRIDFGSHHEWDHSSSMFLLREPIKSVDYLSCPNIYWQSLFSVYTLNELNNQVAKISNNLNYDLFLWFFSFSFPWMSYFGWKGCKPHSTVDTLECIPFYQENFSLCRVWFHHPNMDKLRLSWSEYSSKSWMKESHSL